jgi:hypothetical protein
LVLQQLVFGVGDECGACVRNELCVKEGDNQFEDAKMAAAAVTTTTVAFSGLVEGVKKKGAACSRRIDNQGNKVCSRLQRIIAKPSSTIEQEKIVN